MDSKEFGLVGAQQLFHIEDIHYGFWEKDEVATLNNFKKAQKKHTKFLFQYIDNFIENKNQSKILDIGCGVGVTIKKLLNKGYKVDGLVPYHWMAKYASNITSKYKSQDRGRIYKCKIEDFTMKEIEQKYQLVFFSESFQYVNMELTFNVLEKILEKHSTIIIFDFFKKDNIEGLSPLGGGHSINLFYNIRKKVSICLTFGCITKYTGYPDFKFQSFTIIKNVVFRIFFCISIIINSVKSRRRDFLSFCLLCIFN